MRKLLRMVMTVVFTVSITTTALAGSRFDEAFDYCVDKGIIYDWYDTEGLVTRGEAAKLIREAMRRFKNINVFYPENPFFDLNMVSAEDNAVVAMYYNGIFAGGYDENGHLMSMKEEYITREDAAALLVRTYGFEQTETELAFIDADMISDYAVNDIMTCVKLGIFNGYDDGSIKPKANISKKEFLNLIYKADVAADADNKHLDTVSLVTEDMLTDDIRISIENGEKIKYGHKLLLKFENLSNTQYTYNPADFQLEVEMNGQWIVLTGGTDIDDVAYILKPNSARSGEVNIYDEEISLREGRYRIIFALDEDSGMPAWQQSKRPSKYSEVEFYM